jgi:AraC-like DNA-binding protein
MPWSKVLSFTDPFTYQTAIRAVDLELYPTAKGEFRAELTQVCLTQLWMQRTRENLSRVGAGTIRPGRRVIGFLTDANSPAFQDSGMNISPGDVVVNNFDVTHQRTAGGFCYGTMSLTTDDLDAACTAVTGREFSESPLKHVVRPSPKLMSRLLRLHELVGQISKNTPDTVALPEVARSLEQQLIHLMVRCLTEGAPSKTSAGARRHDAIVARFEEFLEANPHQPLYLTEICAAIAVSERTLRAACEEHLGMGPIRYLTLRRMHLVRRALLRADLSTATVTRLATDHGFWELGRFSVAYRALFDESPSESLRRPPDHHRILLNRPSALAPILHS